MFKYPFHVKRARWIFYFLANVWLHLAIVICAATLMFLLRQHEVLYILVLMAATPSIARVYFAFVIWFFWCVVPDRWLRRRATKYACPICGFDIHDTPNRCPKCGHDLAWGMLPDSAQNQNQSMKKELDENIADRE